MTETEHRANRASRAEKATAPKEGEISLTELSAKVSHLSDSIDKVNFREAGLTKWMFSILGILIAVSGIVTFFGYKDAYDMATASIERNEARVAGALEKSERYYEKVLGVTRPQKVQAFGVVEREPSAIQFNLTIETWLDNGARRWYVDATGRVNVKIFGAPGRLVGSQNNLSGEFANFLATNEDGNINQDLLKQIEAPDYSPEGRDGLLVVEAGTIDLNFRFQRTFSKCENAEASLRALVEKQNRMDLGRLFVSPVFEDIESVDPRPFEFQVKVFAGNSLSCTQFTEAIVWDELQRREAQNIETDKE